MGNIEDYPRAAVVYDLDDSVAWLRPHALICGKYTHPLPEGTFSDFGVGLEELIARKGIKEALALGDTFRTASPTDERIHVISDGTRGRVNGFDGFVGPYIPEAEML